MDAELVAAALIAICVAAYFAAKKYLCPRCGGYFRALSEEEAKYIIRDDKIDRASGRQCVECGWLHLNWNKNVK